MRIDKIHVFSFRNFPDKVFSFSKETTVIVGPNGAGKTNILESVFLLSSGKSFRAKVEEEMIAYDEEIGRVKGLIDTGTAESKDKLEAILTRGEIGIGTTSIEKVARKKVLINGVSKRVIDFAGILRTVLFGPWDLELITESPSIRRRFLDNVLSQVDHEYRRAILSYEKGIRQRNRLLFRIREEGISRSQLLFWNQLLIKNGDYISGKREEFIEYINSTEPLDGGSYKIEYDKSIISEGRLEQYAREEVAAATTLVGPHRDDFLTKSKGAKRDKDLARYGSRGEQRMAVLWLKLGELSFIETHSTSSGQGRPVLLLDDIFSELDEKHREIVMEVAMAQQTIITTADPHYIQNIEKLETIDLS